MADFESIFSTNNAGSNNRVGTIESMLSGVASGLIAIPKGFFLIRCQHNGPWCQQW